MRNKVPQIGENPNEEQYDKAKHPCLPLSPYFFLSTFVSLTAALVLGQQNTGGERKRGRGTKFLLACQIPSYGCLCYIIRDVSNDSYLLLVFKFTFERARELGRGRERESQGGSKLPIREPGAGLELTKRKVVT